MRILVTNDDGVFAPGIAALARGLADAFDGEHDLVVVAPLRDYSGASSAVGRVYERETIPYEPVEVPGLEHVPTYGVDGPPALCAILACIGGFGPRPDLIVSGINHGTNAGRSALHSGTIGATLTGAQFGARGLAVSIAWSKGDVPWETPVALAVGTVPVVGSMAPGTVLNLNAPSVPLAELRGVRHGTLGTHGLIRGVRTGQAAGQANEGSVDTTAGGITLSLRGGRGADPAEERAEVGSGTDAALLGDGWASLTALVGVREDTSANGEEAVAKALAMLEGLAGG